MGLSPNRAFKSPYRADKIDRNFFMPPRLESITCCADGAALPELLAAFEEFWDSEQPRIGEAGALGWRAWDEARHSSEPRVLEPSTIDPTSQDPFAAWYEIERQVSVRDRRPMRAIDVSAEEEDDPYRIVLFSDIQQNMVLIQSQRAKMQLARGSLAYLGLSRSVAAYESGRDLHAFTANEFVRAQLWPDHSSKQSPSATVPPVKTWRATPEMLFGASADGFALLDRHDLDHVDTTVSKSVLADEDAKLS